jgi:hypothetical protein
MARGARSRHRPKRSKPESAADAFFSLPFEQMFAKLDRPTSAVVSDWKAAAFGRALEGVRMAQQADLPLFLAATSNSSSLRPPDRNAIETLAVYKAVQDRFKGVVAQWKATVPKRRKKADARKERDAAAGRLKERLRTAFPDMHDDCLTELVDSLKRSEKSEKERSEKAWSQIRAGALGAYVGNLLKARRPDQASPVVGASVIRRQVAAARKAIARWRPFLAWIATKEDRTLHEDMAELAEILEWYRRWIAGPLPADYYETFGPLCLGLVRLRAAPPDHPGAAAVGDWLKSFASLDREASVKYVAGWPDWRGWRTPTE